MSSFVREDLESLNKAELIDIILKHGHNNKINQNKKRLFSETDLKKNNDIICNTNGKKKRKKIRKKQKPFVMSDYLTQHVAFKLVYLGHNYDGLMIQENSSNTIEHHLFSALIHTHLIEDPDKCNYSRSGRTDKGVSSFGNVIALTVRGKRKNANENDRKLNYARILNKVLPVDIRILSFCKVSDDFNARFACKGRIYKYLFFKEIDMDISKMENACKLLIGQHDYRNFCKIDVVNVRNFVRSIHDISIDQLNDNLYAVTIKGRAFLWHQIRCIMSVLLMIANGKEECEIIDFLLKSEHKPQYEMASHIPLILWDCVYDSNDLEFDITNDEDQNIEHHLFSSWNVEWRKKFVINHSIKMFMNQIVPKNNKFTTKFDQFKVIKNDRKNKHSKLKDRVKGMSYDERIKNLQNSKLTKFQKKEKKILFFKNQQQNCDNDNKNDIINTKN